VPAIDESRTESERRRSSSNPVDRTLWLLGALSLVLCLCATSIGFQNSLFDFHAFRQTQTAITADSMIHGGSFLHYETPVLGSPWSLPFEFPLYQGIVAAIAKSFSTPLDQTGRAVSLFFYYLCFFPLASILSRIGFRRTQAIPVIVLFAVSPLYVFVSRLFMIESTALFLSLMYVDQMCRLMLGSKPWRSWHLAGAAMFGVLAGLVKPTTFAPYLAVGIGLVLWRVWTERKMVTLNKSPVAMVGFLTLILPVVVTWYWTRFADATKAHNPIGFYLTSKAVSSWTYGTVAQRLDIQSYTHLVGGTHNYLGSLFAPVAVVLVYALLCRRWNWIALTCVILWAGTIAIFFNLFFIHEYYPYSIGIFLIVAMGVLISSVLQLPRPRAWIGVGLLIFAMAGCAFRYFRRYYPVQKVNASGLQEASAIIDTTTTPRQVILIMGLDWSPELPYQSHRRALMVPGGGDTFHSLTLTSIESSITDTGSQNFGALVACDDARTDARLSALLRDVAMAQENLQRADNCDIYEPKLSDKP
jgi:hypothetical protein